MSTGLKAVIAGCGSISRTWLDAIRLIPDLEMVGFVDINAEAAASRRAQYGGRSAQFSDDLSQTLEETRPDIVFDCTVPQAHFSVTMAALQHGCHVLGEKPLADTMAGARAMVQAAQDAGKIYAVMQNRRYDPNIRRLCAFLTSGAIGRVTTINCDFMIGAHFGGFRDLMRHVLLLDMAIHTFDAARLIAGSAPGIHGGDPVAVYCKEWNPAGSWYAHDASAIAIFDMTGGLVYTYRGSWCAEGLNTAWESNWHIIGTDGSARWDGQASIEVEVVVHRGSFISKTRAVDPPPYDGVGRVGGHAGCIQEFVECVRSSELPETVCTDNIRSLAMVFGAIKSAEHGKSVAIDVGV